MQKYIDADALRKRMEQIAEESKPAATARPMREDTPKWRHIRELKKLKKEMEREDNNENRT